MSAVQAPVHEPHRFLGDAQTELGRCALRWFVWSFGVLAADVTFAVLSAAIFDPQLFAILVFVFGASWVLGVAAGVAAAVAIWRGERALIVYLAFLPIIGTLYEIVHIPLL